MFNFTLTLIFTIFIKTCITQNCYECLGTTESGIQKCGDNPTNNTKHLASLDNTCMQKVVFNITSCPPKGNCLNLDAELLQVSRGLPEIQLEYQLLKTQQTEIDQTSSGKNLTGFFCNTNGELLTCTNYCSGNLCNSNSLSKNLNEFTKTIKTECVNCKSLVSGADFQDCLLGENSTNFQPETCVANYNDVGNVYLSGMCVTVVNYDNSTLEPISVYRGCGIDQTTKLYRTTGVIYSTLGQCSDPSVIVGYETANNQDNEEVSVVNKTITTISCVKGLVQELNENGVESIANYGLSGPSPMNASCLFCESVYGDVTFDACLSPDGTGDVKIGVDVCELGIQTCVSSFGYDENGQILGVQRGCGSKDSENLNFDTCFDTDDGNGGSGVLCVSQCQASGVPCNDYNIKDSLATTAATTTSTSSYTNSTTSSNNHQIIIIKNATAGVYHSFKFSVLLLIIHIFKL